MSESEVFYEMELIIQDMKDIEGLSRKLREVTSECETCLELFGRLPI